jgi:hypothetical protein
MRLTSVTAIAFAGALSIAHLSAQQPAAQQPPAQPPAGGGQRMGGMQMNPADAARKVPGGGIFASGWKGKVDAGEAKNGSTINDSKFEGSGGSFTIASGPAGIFYNPADAQTADYTVSATFTEPAFQSAMSHAHPYGLFIGGNDLESDTPTFLYCTPYGNGNFIVRAFPTTFAPPGPSGRRPTPNDAVHKAAGKGEPVTQDVSMSVKGSQVTCSINGTVVATFTKDDLVGDGKLKSVEGTPGIRVAHNVDVKVTNYKVTKQ